MRSEQEIARAQQLLDAALKAQKDGLEPDYRLILLASLDVLAWVLEQEEGKMFESVMTGLAIQQSGR